MLHILKTRYYLKGTIMPNFVVQFSGYDETIDVIVEAATKDEAWRKAEAVVDPFEGDIEIVGIEYSGE